MDHNIDLHISGTWRPAADGRTIPILNPANGMQIGAVALAGPQDLEEAAAAAERGFEVWRRVAPADRAKIMRHAAELLRERAEPIGRLLTMEQGKPLSQAIAEAKGAADVIDWLAEEARRSYGRVVPARQPGVQQLVLREPVGPVAAFTPWNFPINQVVRKLSAALATGCSIIVKGPEETPASPAELIRCFVDAGVPADVIGLVYGVPAEISAFLISHPVIRKVTFTGSTAVGKQLASLAGLHMKRTTMELGGHAPVLVFDDADIPAAAKLLAATKVRNAGQVCVSPTRFLVQEAAFDEFVDTFSAYAKSVRVGDGLTEGTEMGPLANERRIPALEALIGDAVDRGAEVVVGGNRIGSQGHFFEPTVITNVDTTMRLMHEEPFSPLAIMVPFSDTDDAIAEANRLPYGLASFAFTRSAARAHAVATAIEAGMVGINHVGLGAPEVPFGGIKDSGYGSEGGTEAIEAYLSTKLVTQTF